MIVPEKFLFSIFYKMKRFITNSKIKLLVLIYEFQSQYDKKYTSNFIFELMIILLTYPVLSIKYISNKKETGGVINDNVFFVVFQEAYSRMNLCILSS